jgi:nonsense-mediated mRNA decay protein 3
MDTHSNTANYKFSYSVEIAPICKDDLVCLPPKLAKQLGNISPLLLCTRVGNSIHFVDPATLQTAELAAHIFWRTPFEALANVTDLVEFTVLDAEPSGAVNGKWVEADAQVALNGAFTSRRVGGGADDDGLMDYEGASAADQIYHTRTHLGAILQPGDSAMGFHLSHANFNSDEFAALPAHRVPDLVLVKKSYPNRRKKNKPRSWRIQSMAKEAEGAEDGRGVVGRLGGRDQRKVEQDYELFFRDLEEDAEMRGAVNLFKAKDTRPEAGSGMAGGKTRRKQPAAPGGMDVDEAPAPGGADSEEEEADFPAINVNELLDEFDQMALGDGEEGGPSAGN